MRNAGRPRHGAGAAQRSATARADRTHPHPATRTAPDPEARLACCGKDAGWRTGGLTVWWEPGQGEPLVLFSTRPGGRERVREYRQRMRVEATYGDAKRRGLRLDQSRIDDPARLERLLLA